jgi:hypothetical protein
MSFAHAGGDHIRVVELPNASVPDAEMDAFGTIHLAYLSQKNIHYAYSADGGVSFSSPVRVNVETGLAAGGLFRGPDLALGKDGRVHIAWYNSSNGLKQPEHERGFMYSRMNEDRQGFEPARNLSGHPVDGYSLAADANGNVAAVWVDDGLFVSLSIDDGSTFSAPLLQRPEPCECCGTRALYAPGGNLFYVYRDSQNNDRDMYLGRLGREPNTSFPIKLNAETWHIEACPMSGNFLIRHDDNLLAAWESKDGVYFSRLNQQGGVESPSEVKVSDRGRYPVVLGNETELLVAWKRGASLYWHLFDMNGNRLGQVNSINTSQQGRRPAGVVLSNGNFLLFP